MVTLTLVMVAVVVITWLAPRGVTSAILVLPLRNIPLLSWAVKWAERQDSPVSGERWQGVFDTVNNVLLRRFLPKDGYFDPHSQRLYPEHLYAAGFFVMSGGLYIYATAVFPNPIPALAYVFLLVTLLCWTLAGLAFLLDAYRIPLLLVLGLWLLVAWLFPHSDHFYEVYTASTVEAPTPAEVLKKRGSKVVLVAAEGGGIQAAAWTAQVLAGLEQEFCEKFRESIALISGVSGGSIGAMYYANSFRSFPPGKSFDAGDAATAAMQSSLDDVGWGLLGPDLQRAALPLLLAISPYIDRGWALEHSLRRHARLYYENSERRPMMMGDWAQLAASGSQPALIFNATIAETGEPLLFTTTNYPSQGQEGIYNFQQLYKGKWDVSVSTAVRLSATFPYVSPAARPVTEVAAEALHVVDGGYYDNFGMMSLMGWLDHGLENLDQKKRPSKI